MTLFTSYEPAAAACSGGPTAGAEALMAYWLGAYGDDGAYNLGIYNCRPVAGGGSPSVHGEGRATDLGVDPLSADYGWEAADALRVNSLELGVQCVIWDGRIWSGSYPEDGWRDYNGWHPHDDHLHVELSHWMAARLDVEHLNAVLGAAVPVAHNLGRGPRLLSYRPGRALTRGEDVARFQRVINAWYPWLNLKVDGRYGPRTADAAREVQRRSPGLDVDGVVGPETRRVLGL